MENAPPAVPIEQFFDVTSGIYSGGSPEGDEAFAALERLGVKTIVSVDGARPDVEAARKHGIRYIHIPTGYDGVDEVAALKIVKAAKETDAPIFVHCHHGKHRGPTAVALACIGTRGWTVQQGTDFMRKAGTGANYKGLWKTVEAFKPPTEAEIAAAGELPESAEPGTLVDSMVAIDLAWDRIKLFEKSGFKVPAGSPDLDPAREALIVREHYAELLRSPEVAARGRDFVKLLEESQTKATTLEAALRDADGAATATAFAALGASCKSCHQQFRD